MLFVLGVMSAASTRAVGQQTQTPASAPVKVEPTTSVDEGPPLEAGALEEAARLDSAANDATPVERSLGDAGSEVAGGDADSSGAGQPRGEASDGEAASYGGLATTLNESTLDGLSVEQGFRAGLRGMAGGVRGWSAYRLGAVRRLEVTTRAGVLRAFDVQSGGAGGVMRAVTQAGTAQVHGSVTWSSQESALAAVNPYSVATSYNDGVVTTATVKPGGVMNQVSVSVGAPVQWRGMTPRWQQRVVAFGVVDARFDDDHVVSSPQSAAFFALTAEQMALLGNRGVSAAATNAALDYLSSLTGTTARSAYRMAGVLRMDAEVSARDHVTLGFDGDRVDAPAGVALGQASDAVVARGRGSLGDALVNVAAGSAHWVRRLGKNAENEVRGQVLRDDEQERPRQPLAQEPGIGPGGLAPQVSIGPEGFAYGTPSQLGRSAYPAELRYEVGDTLRLKLGRHALTLGGSWSRVWDTVSTVANAEGAFDYDSGTTNGRDGGLVDWITDYTFNVNAYPNGGCPSINAAVHEFCFRTYSQGFGAQTTAFATHTFAGWAQDTLQLRKDLTLLLGARYDYTLLPLPQMPNAVLDSDLAALGVRAATARFPEDRNNAGPRVAAVWSPTWAHGATVEAGYGVFFGRVPGATVRAALMDTAMAASSLHVRITPATVTQCPQAAGSGTAGNQGFGYPCAYTSVPPAAVAQTTSATVFAPGFRAPMVQRAALAVQAAVGGGMSLRASYAMANAHQLPATTDVNIAPSAGLVEYAIAGGAYAGATFVVPLYAQRLIAQYGAVTEVESNANAYYHAATLEATWRAAGTMLRGSYTFSRAIDDGPLQTATPTLNSQFDPFADGYDKGLSTLQFPQRFAGELTYALRWRRGSAATRRVLDGWRVAAIATAGSGAPYSYEVFGGTRLAGGHESLNGSGGATFLPTVGRNTLRLPPRGKVDLRLGREFAVGARWRVSGFAEAFNLLNERSISSVETRAFLVEPPTTTIGGTSSGPEQLVFQDAAAVASEGLTTQAFGTPSSSTTGMSRERRVEFGVVARF